MLSCGCIFSLYIYIFLSFFYDLIWPRYFCSLCLQALDTFNTAVVSPIYYVMFTSFTILASVIMFKVCQRLVVSFTRQCGQMSCDRFKNLHST